MRELENTIERAAVISRGPILEAGNLPFQSPDRRDDASRDLRENTLRETFMPLERTPI